MAEKFNLSGLINANTNSRVCAEVVNIPIGMLVPYHNHMFSLYAGERKDDMIQSIKNNGIMSPILVRPIDDGEAYEILVGHNRMSCAKEIGLGEVPCIIKKNLTEDEAEAYVIESNVIQRGFDNLKTTEKAQVMRNRYASMFSQGKRNDIIKEINALEDGATSGRSRDKLGEEYSLGKTSVSRFLRVAEINNEDIKKWVDEGEVSLRAAVELSFIPESVLDDITRFIDKPKTQLSESNSRALRRLYGEKGEIGEEGFNEITKGKVNKNKTLSVVLPEEVVAKYFMKDDGELMSKKTIIDTIIDALESVYEE